MTQQVSHDEIFPATASSSFIFKSLIKLKTKDNKSFHFNLISSCLTLCKRNKQKSKLLLHLECTPIPFKNQLITQDPFSKFYIPQTINLVQIKLYLITIGWHWIALYCHLSHCRIAKLSSNFAKHSTLHQTDIFRTQLIKVVQRTIRTSSIAKEKSKQG